MNDQSLFQLAAIRLRSSNEVEFGAPITVTNSDFVSSLQSNQSVGIDPGSILIEPEANTTPAILAASLFLGTRTQTLLLVCPRII